MGETTRRRTARSPRTWPASTAVPSRSAAAAAPSPTPPSTGNSANNGGGGGGGIYNDGTLTVTTLTLASNSRRRQRRRALQRVWCHGDNHRQHDRKQHDYTPQLRRWRHLESRHSLGRWLHVLPESGPRFRRSAPQLRTGSIELDNCGFTDNSAGTTGGAISDSNYTGVNGGTISGYTFRGNSVGSQGGGGIAVLVGQLTIANCTIEANSPGSKGEGISCTMAPRST